MPGPTDYDCEHQAIRAMIEAYFSALDRRDWDAYGWCFTKDAVFELRHAAHEVVVGREALVTRARLRADRPVSTHSLSNLHVMVARGHATATTHAVAHLVVHRDGGTRIVVRGLVYEDQLITDEDGIWRISKRKHQPLWQFEADAMPPGY